MYKFVYICYVHCKKINIKIWHPYPLYKISAAVKTKLWIVWVTQRHKYMLGVWCYHTSSMSMISCLTCESVSSCKVSSKPRYMTGRLCTKCARSGDSAQWYCCHRIQLTLSAFISFHIDSNPNFFVLFINLCNCLTASHNSTVRASILYLLSRVLFRNKETCFLLGQRPQWNQVGKSVALNILLLCTHHYSLLTKYAPSI